MASQSAVTLVLLLVLVSAATTLSRDQYQNEWSYNLLSYDNERVQFLGKFAVDQYNQHSGSHSHMYFIEVVDAAKEKPYYPTRPPFYVWFLKVKAKNCTSGTEALYDTTVTENFYLPGQIQAYNSNFTADRYLGNNHY